MNCNVASDSVLVSVSGPPVPKARPRFTVRGGIARVYTPRHVVEYEERIRVAAQHTMGKRPPFDGPVVVRIIAHLSIPKSWSKRRRNDAANGILLPTVRPDIDNFGKVALDALNGIAFVDDKQVISMVCTKLYGTEPGITVTIREYQIPCCTTQK